MQADENWLENERNHIQGSKNDLNMLLLRSTNSKSGQSSCEFTMKTPTPTDFPSLPWRRIAAPFAVRTMRLIKARREAAAPRFRALRISEGNTSCATKWRRGGGIRIAQKYEEGVLEKICMIVEGAHHHLLCYYS